MRCLFVGGPEDGHWHNVETTDSDIGPQPRLTWTLADFGRSPPICTAIELIDPELLTTNHHTYYRQEWLPSRDDHQWLFVSTDLRPHDVFRRLLSNYRPNG